MQLLKLGYWDIKSAIIKTYYVHIITIPLNGSIYIYRKNLTAFFEYLLFLSLAYIGLWI